MAADQRMADELDELLDSLAELIIRLERLVRDDQRERLADILWNNFAEMVLET